MKKYLLAVFLPVKKHKIGHLYYQCCKSPRCSYVASGLGIALRWDAVTTSNVLRSKGEFGHKKNGTAIHWAEHSYLRVACSS